MVKDPLGKTVVSLHARRETDGDGEMAGVGGVCSLLPGPGPAGKRGSVASPPVPQWEFRERIVSARGSKRRLPRTAHRVGAPHWPWEASQNCAPGCRQLRLLVGARPRGTEKRNPSRAASEPRAALLPGLRALPSWTSSCLNRGPQGQKPPPSPRHLRGLAGASR